MMTEHDHQPEKQPVESARVYLFGNLPAGMEIEADEVAGTAD